MKYRQIKIGFEAKQAIKSGIDIVADTVVSTLGPSGKYVIIDHDSMHPQITNDGVTVAKAITLQDKFQNLGAKLIKEVASKTNSDSGDGTTTATLLTQTMIDAGLKHLIAGRNPVKMVEGINATVSEVIRELNQFKTEVRNNEGILRIASISANDKVLGTLIAGAYEKVGKQGIVLIEENTSADTIVDVIEGFSFDRGWQSPYFINQQNGSAKYEDCNILISNDKLDNIYNIIEFLQKAFQTEKPLLIIAPDIEGDVLGSLVVSKAKNNLPVVAVKSPWFGDRRKDILEDLALVTGATMVSKALGHNFNKMPLTVLGRAKKVIVNKETTVLVTEKTPELDVKITDRIAEINGRINDTTGDYNKDKERERIAKLTGGLAVIKVGGATESELTAKKYKIEDAVNAVRSAIAEGVVPGGGYTFLQLQSDLGKVPLSGDVGIGRQIVLDTLSAPFNKICSNAGYTGEVIAANVIDNDILFNAKTGDYELVQDTVVLDPVKTCRCALENAASITNLLLTTDAIMVESEEEKK